MEQLDGHHLNHMVEVSIDIEEHWQYVPPNKMWYSKKYGTSPMHHCDKSQSINQSNHENWKQALNQIFVDQSSWQRIQNNQRVKTAQMSISGGRDKQNAVHTHNGILLYLLKEWDSDTLHQHVWLVKPLSMWNKSHTKGQILCVSTYMMWLE